MGIVGIVCIALKKAADKFDLPVESVIEKLNQMTFVQVLIGTCLLAAAATILSFVISLNIMNKKEF